MTSTMWNIARDSSSYGLKDILSYSREGVLRRLIRLRMIGIHFGRVCHYYVKDGGLMDRCGRGLSQQAAQD
jgi:hypothetical protein